MGIELITVLMFGLFLITLALGIPLVFSLGAIGVAFAWALWGPQGLYVVAVQTFGVISKEVFVAVPLFIFMGNLLQRSGVADALYEMMYRWSGRLPGGLAIGTIAVSTLIAAMSGVAGAAAVALGLFALPSMLDRGYSKSVAMGCIMGGATLAILIPPSVTMVIFGTFSLMSIGQFFIAGVMPGIMIAIMFIIYLIVASIRNPKIAPPLPPERRASWKEKFASLTAILPALLVIASVLGSIFTGAATPTEAAAVGAVGTLVVAAIYRQLNWKMVKEACFRTVRVTSMVMYIIIAASIFAAVYQRLGASQMMRGLLVGQEWNPMLIMVGILVLILILGMFLDSVAIIILLVPIVCPTVVALGFNLLHFATLFIVALMVGYLSPPFGLCLFYMRGVAPPEVSTEEIYHAVIPYIVILIIALAILLVFPDITLWLPRLMMGREIVG
jgi:tripartite ATP-independent transporter DctM subunit